MAEKNHSDERGRCASAGAAALPELLRKQDVAEILSVSTRTVERLVAQGEFSGGVLRRNGIVRITRTAVESFVQRSIERE